ncbi:MAG: helix-turn-helix domain-containing protein [Thermoleophilaceae bacterium]|nr:helix-turn-helix domain-containing protein [Thermoleophilaceae bacterium]
MGEIGETLRERRMALKIDVHEVEEATKIRAKYLRALENEEYDLLPGSAYVKSFLRTYADYLELDSRALVDEYRSLNHHTEEEPMVYTPAPVGRTRGYGRWLMVLGVIALVVVLLFFVGVLGGSGSS